MAKVKFTLVHDNDVTETPFKEFPTLLSCFRYIRAELNVPQNWTVNEVNGEEVEDFANANYLIQNYTEQTLPRTLSEIPYF